MQTKQQKGQVGETLALKLLEKKGFELVERNYRHRKGEIDLIVQKANLTVFVEVKLRKNDHFGLPESFVRESQQTLIIQTAEHFIYETNWEGDIRFDIISILESNAEIEHIEDAFY